MLKSALGLLSLLPVLLAVFVVPTGSVFAGERLVIEEGELRVEVQPAGDAWLTSDRVGLEEERSSRHRLVINDADSPHAFDYTVSMSGGLFNPIPLDGAIRFMPSEPHRDLTTGGFLPRSFELERPVVVDSAGQTSTTAASWTVVRDEDRMRLRLTVDATGLQHPLIVTTGFRSASDLEVTRNNHVAALLPNGSVLIAGGYDGVHVLASAEIYHPVYAGFIPVIAPMSVPRQNAAAVVLPDGKVLIVGGNDGTGPVASAELFDPQTKTFTPVVGTMTTTRNNPTATLLNDGTVLIAGGIHPAAISTAEIWNPSTQLFTETSGPMATPRVAHTATLLPSGDVLVAGGTDGTARYASAEIYHPSTRTFSIISNAMTSVRALHTATLLPNGRVLLTGGLSATVAVATAELYDPVTESFSATAGAMMTARYFHTATLLPEGKVLVDGAHAMPEIYDPASSTFSDTGDVSQIRYNATATLLPTGAVLIAGGSDGSAPTKTAVVFVTNTTGSITAGNGWMMHLRSGSTAALLPDGRVLIAGGGELTPLDEASLYDPVANTLSPTGSMTVPRMHHTATALGDGKVLIAGRTFEGASSSHAETYDPSTGTFTSTATPMFVGRGAHTATLLRDGTVLIAGGYPDTNRAEIYDPATRRFTEVGTMTTARRKHAATLLDNGRVLITGGLTGDAPTSSAELFDPATRTFQAIPSMINERHSHTATRLRNGNVLITGGSWFGSVVLADVELYVPGIGFFASPSILSARAGHGATLLPNGQLFIAGGYNSSGSLGTTELFDLSWSAFMAGPSLSMPQGDPLVTPLTDGRVFIGGSFDAGVFEYFVVELYQQNPSFAEPRRPAIASITNPVCQPAHLALAGTLFTGDSEASSGRTAANNQPHLRLDRVDGAPSKWLAPESSSAASFFSTVLSRLPSGPYRAAIVSNGVSSVEKIINVETTPLLASYATASVTVGGAIPVPPTSTPAGYEGALYAQRASASGAFTGSLSVGQTGLVSIEEAGPVGNYTITVASSNSCGSASTTFQLKVIGPPSSMVASGGTPQSAAVNSAFATPLQVTVTDSAGHPLQNVSVAFTAPAAGASATFSPANSALTNASGIATVNATANGVMGAYNATATVGALTASFALTNVPATPIGTNALATTATSVSVAWTGTPGATYQVARVSAGGLTTLGTSTTGAYVDATAIAGTAYLYKVRATAPFVTAYGAPDLATTVIFTDPSLTAGTTPIKAAHITQLRTAVNAVRALALLGAGIYTDPAISATVTKAKAVHITDLRTALGAARAALTLPTVTFLRPSPAGLPIQTTEIVELRNGVK